MSDTPHHDLGQPMYDALNALSGRVRALDAFAGPALAGPLEACIGPIVDAYVAVTNALSAQLQGETEAKVEAEQRRDEHERQIAALYTGLMVAVGADDGSPNDCYGAEVLAWFRAGAAGDAPVRVSLVGDDA